MQKRNEIPGTELTRFGVNTSSATQKNFFTSGQHDKGNTDTTVNNTSNSRSMNNNNNRANSTKQGQNTAMQQFFAKFNNGFKNS